jgi:UDP-glucose 6-dehydrogenase
MVDKKNLYISAFIALSIYVFLVLLLLLYLQESNIKKIDATIKNTVLQLDIVFDTPNNEKKAIKIKSEDSSEQAQKVVKKTTSNSLKQKSDLKSLFADVKTTAKKVNKEKILNVKKSTVSSRFKSKFEKEKKVKEVVISELLKQQNQNSVKKVVLSESKNETDPYFSEIYQMLSSRWSPTVFSNNLSAKVLVTITNNGNFSFKFIQYSQNIGFDQQLKDFLIAESLKRYPINPNDNTTNIEILFQSKG